MLLPCHIIEIEHMIRKQSGVRDGAMEEGEEVRVLGQLEEGIRRQVEGVKEVKRKVEERRRLERN